VLGKCTAPPSGGVRNRAALAKHIEAKYPLPEWVHSLTTMKINGAKAAYPLPQYTEEGSYSAFPFCEPFPVKTLTLKGRIEFRKDYKAILFAASQIPGIASLKYDGFTVEITWLSKGISKMGRRLILLKMPRGTSLCLFSKLKRHQTYCVFLNWDWKLTFFGNLLNPSMNTMVSATGCGGINNESPSKSSNNASLLQLMVK
jgi:hypothetical protein